MSTHCELLEYPVSSEIIIRELILLQIKLTTDSKVDCLDTHKVYLSFQTFLYKGLKLIKRICFECSGLFLCITVVDVVGVNH